MKTRNKWALVLLVLAVVACVGWFAVSLTFTSELSYSASLDVILYGREDVEKIFGAARATVHRLGYKTTHLTLRSDHSDLSLKATHEDGAVVEIRVYSEADGPPRILIQVTDKVEDPSLQDVSGMLDDVSGMLDGLAPSFDRAQRILEATTARLDSQ